MGFVPCINVAEVTLSFTLDSQVCQNVYHVLKDSAWTEPTLSALMTGFRGWFNTDGKTAVPTGTELFRIDARDLTTQGGLVTTVAVDPPIAGTRTGSLLPNNVTYCVTEGTGFSGKWFRGRTYVVGVTETDSVDSAPTGSLQTAVLDAFVALVAAIAALGHLWVVLSRRFNKADRAVGVATPVISLAADDILDSQRRRLPGRGR